MTFYQKRLLLYYQNIGPATDINSRSHYSPLTKHAVFMRLQKKAEFMNTHQQTSHFLYNSHFINPLGLSAQPAYEHVCMISKLMNVMIHRQSLTQTCLVVLYRNVIRMGGEKVFADDFFYFVAEESVAARGTLETDFIKCALAHLNRFLFLSFCTVNCYDLGRWFNSPQ